MELVNLTPHPICLATPGGERITLLRSGAAARVETEPAEPYEVAGIPVPVLPPPVWGEVSGLPPPREGTVYLVSALVAARCADRGDVYAPATGPADGAIREGGQVVAVTRLLAARAPDGPPRCSVDEPRDGSPLK